MNTELIATELIASQVYDIKKDAWVFHFELPCSVRGKSHDGKLFKDSSEEMRHYAEKLRKLLNAFPLKEKP